MTDETRPFWTESAGATQAFTRPPKPTRRQWVETRITRVRDLYDIIQDWNDTLWDWAPAIGALLVLIWLITTFHR